MSDTIRSSPTANLNKTASGSPPVRFPGCGGIEHGTETFARHDDSARRCWRTSLSRPPILVAAVFRSPRRHETTRGEPVKFHITVAQLRQMADEMTVTFDHATRLLFWFMQRSRPDLNLAKAMGWPDPPAPAPLPNKPPKPRRLTPSQPQADREGDLPDKALRSRVFWTSLNRRGYGLPLTGDIPGDAVLHC